MELCGLPKARPIVWSDCPAFQRHHRSVICAAESLTRFPWAIDTTSEKKIYIRWCCTDLLRPPDLPGVSTSGAKSPTHCIYLCELGSDPISWAGTLWTLCITRFTSACEIVVDPFTEDAQFFFCHFSIWCSRSAARRRMTVRPWSFKRKTVPVCGLSRRWITPEIVASGVGLDGFEILRTS